MRNLHHRCRSMQIFGGAKDFRLNFPKLARKKLQRKWPPEKRLHFLVHFFKSKHNSSTIVELAQISPNLPENNKIKIWPPKEKKTSAPWFWVPFLKNQSAYSDFANVFTNFAKISTDFARILSDFVRIFTKSKVFGVRLHPLQPPPPIPVTLTEPHYTFCGTPVEKHWPTFSGALVNTIVLTLLLKSFAGKNVSVAAF